MTHFHAQRLERLEGEWSRRRLLTLGGLAAAAILAPRPVLAHLRRSGISEKSLAFYNPHTGESLKTVYWTEGTYVPEALADINRLCRDYRCDEIIPIDLQLLDLLFAVHKKLEARQPFHIVSAYRSPATNAMLRQHNRGVAKNSLHIQGKAVDMRLPGRRIATVRRVAVSLRQGGVGYYPRSDFVHIDTGEVRYW